MHTLEETFSPTPLQEASEDTLRSEQRVGKYLPRVLSRIDLLVVFIAVVVFIPDSAVVQTTQAAGPITYVYWLVGTVTFLVPGAIVVAQLNRFLPVDGSIYVWTHRALGSLWGFFAGFCAWFPAFSSSSRQAILSAPSFKALACRRLELMPTGSPIPGSRVCSSFSCSSWDEIRLKQILRNLLANALRYSPAHTPLAITAVLEQEEGIVRIKVIDRGWGVPPEKHEAIFERFVRLERDLHGTNRGSGLGLAITRQLVEAMQGTITVESSGISGEGSTFTFTLPVAPPAASDGGCPE